AIVLPGLLLVEDLVRGRLRARLGDVAACAAVVAAFLVGRVGGVGGAFASAIDDKFAGLPAANRILTAVGVLAREARLLVFPLRLSADYSFDQIPIVRSPADPVVLAGVAAIGVSVA